MMQNLKEQRYAVEAKDGVIHTWRMDVILKGLLSVELKWIWKLLNVNVSPSYHFISLKTKRLIAFYFLQVFAPIVLVMKYSTIPHAIEIANSTRYGLGASVFGPDQLLALKVAKRLECGMVAINDFGVFYVRMRV